MTPIKSFIFTINCRKLVRAFHMKLKSNLQTFQSLHLIYFSHKLPTPAYKKNSFFPKFKLLIYNNNMTKKIQTLDPKTIKFQMKC